VEHVQDARLTLLERLIDHAPLFPPASLPLPEALLEDERARESPSAFVLGRFVCPASRLGAVPGVGRGISVVLDAPLEADSRVEAVEVPPSAELDALLPCDATEVYVEVPLGPDLECVLDRLQARGLRAKVRCGGASVPSEHELARFLCACRERGVVFKATAGLHHALRRDGEHGFLNLLAAVVFGDEEEALAESDRDAFALDREMFSWRGRTAGAAELGRARHERLHSIGSCSFFEPVAELEALGVLPL
jgi:hypothetical protein